MNIPKNNPALWTLAIIAIVNLGLLVGAPSVRESACCITRRAWIS